MQFILPSKQLKHTKGQPSKITSLPTETASFVDLLKATT